VLFVAGNTDDIDFKVFYPKDFTEAKMDEIKLLIEDLSKKS
jgi:hypothetical protein